MSNAVTADVVAPLVLTPCLGPESLFQVGPMTYAGSTARAPMAVGPWLGAGAGRPMAGALGVLLDDTLGQAVIAHRPDGHWAVTTELAIDIAAPLPLSGPGIEAVAERVLVDGAGGLGRGVVIDGTGRPIAAGSTWSRFVPGVPQGVYVSGPVPGPADLPPPAEILCPEAGGVRLPAHAFLANPAGVVHGGVLAWAAEQVARGVAPPALDTASLRAVYLRPGIAPVTFVPRVVHAGRSLALVEVTATAADGRPCTTVTIGFRAASLG
ncbi:MAG: thioesterase family protein [Actinomycetia bacterium]|nr:thioesterase family protein [Actinomycetes bacterium]